MSGTTLRISSAMTFKLTGFIAKALIATFLDEYSSIRSLNPEQSMIGMRNVEGLC